jgi:hypothetical protein
MKSPITLALLLLVSALPALAQRVYVDYDTATAFSEYKTFQYRETREDLRDVSRTSHQRVVDQLVNYAVEGGLEEVSSDPDFYLAYYTADRGSLRLAMNSLEYSYGDSFSPGAYWEGGVGTRTPDSFSFKQGTLVVDAWDAERRQLVWRGIATAAVPSDLDKVDRRIAKALEKIMKRWEKDRGTHVRALRELKAESQD